MEYIVFPILIVMAVLGALFYLDRNVGMGRRLQPVVVRKAPRRGIREKRER